MEYRLLGKSGLKVPVLSLGTGTFGGRSEFFRTWGTTDLKEASELVSVCLDHGVSFFDTADVYSSGQSEEILGAALEGRRDQCLVATKATFTMGPGVNDKGSSRYHILKAVDASLKRLRTDRIDLLFMHAFDALTPVEETLWALDDLVRSGKVLYLGCSNYSGWQVMRALATSEKFGLHRYVAYQGYYSLLGRDYEWELMPLAADQGLGTMVWSPLGWGRLTGKIRRGQPLPEGRIKQGGDVGGPVVSDEKLFHLVDALEACGKELGKTVAQVALNWVMQRPTVANVVMGARNKQQLIDNLGALGWQLPSQMVAHLDKMTETVPPYPYWHQQQFKERIPPVC